MDIPLKLSQRSHEDIIDTVAKRMQPRKVSLFCFLFDLRLAYHLPQKKTKNEGFFSIISIAAITYCKNGCN